MSDMPKSHALRVEALTIRLEAIASRLEAIAIRLEAIAIRLRILIKSLGSAGWRCHRGRERGIPHENARQASGLLAPLPGCGSVRSVSGTVAVAGFRASQAAHSSAFKCDIERKSKD